MNIQPDANFLQAMQSPAITVVKKSMDQNSKLQIKKMMSAGVVEKKCKEVKRFDRN